MLSLPYSDIREDFFHFLYEHLNKLMVTSGVHKKTHIDLRGLMSRDLDKDHKRKKTQENDKDG